MNFTIKDHKIEIFGADKTGKLPFIILIGDRDEAEEVYEIVRTRCDQEFILIAIHAKDWNSELSPWYCDPVFKGTEAFAGKADDFLTLIINEILPQLNEYINTSPSYYALCGYSLAGLFALYSAYRCDSFQKIVSASGSLWYPGFIEMVTKEKISKEINTVYLSLGDSEAKTRNQLMARVQDNSEKIAAYLSQNINTVLELNEGNHFNDPELRIAKGIAYILNT
ncbi:MAG: hypothetical protein IJI46_02325 [Erysipelotrichaceae bacterium]|nr:hypothetical protein [Erysipelotrichaceae bacterium]